MKKIEENRKKEKERKEERGNQTLAHLLQTRADAISFHKGISGA